MPLVALCMTLVLALAACTPGRNAGQPMTLSHFQNFCQVFPTPNSCDSTTICNDFSNVLSTRAANLDDCLARCRRTKNYLQPSNIINSCNGPLGRASDLCSQFCRQNYTQ